MPPHAPRGGWSLSLTKDVLLLLREGYSEVVTLPGLATFFQTVNTGAELMIPQREND